MKLSWFDELAGDEGFYLAGPTLLAATLLDDSRVCQICTYGVRLVNADAKATQRLSFPEGIKEASVGSPFVILILETEQVVVLKMIDQTLEEEVRFTKPSLSACWVYQDNSGHFTSHSQLSNQQNQQQMDTSEEGKNDVEGMDIDDLYNVDSNPTLSSHPTYPATGVNNATAEEVLQQQRECFLFLCFKNGDLEVFSWLIFTIQKKRFGIWVEWKANGKLVVYKDFLLY